MSDTFGSESIVTANDFKEYNELFFSVWDYSDDGMRVTDSEGKTCLVNDAFSRIVNMDKSELENHIFSKIFLPEDQIESLKKYRKGFDNNQFKDFEQFKVTLWNGREISVRIKHHKFTLRDKEFLLTIYRDVTDRSETEVKLYELSQITDELTIALMVTNNDGNIMYVNPAFTELTGYDLKYSKEPVSPLILSSDKNTKEQIDELWATISGGEIWEGELLNKKKNGELFWCYNKIIPVKHEGKIIRYISLIEDISDKKMIEENLAEYIRKLKNSKFEVEKKATELSDLNDKLKISEQHLLELNASKDKFFSIIAHDLKGPFSAILGYSEFIMEDFEELTSDEVKEFSQNINLVAKNVNQLLENLLDWSRLQTNRMNINLIDLNLLTVFEDVMYLFAEKAKAKSLYLENTLKETVTIHTDLNMITTILRNFISNSIKFTNSNGKISLGISEHNSKFTVVYVEDTGVGMNESTKNKLFKVQDNPTNPGTEEEKGTGLGLILCREMIDKLGGSIWVDTTPNIGSRFSIKIPNNKNQV